MSSRAAESRLAVLAALGGNLVIAITKFAAATLTGSSAMLGEAIHSTVDVGNQLVLMLGMRRAQRPPDDAHPFGHARELYFWTFVVALLLFSLGGGVSFYEGVRGLLHPEPIEHGLVNWIVLGVAFVFEGGSWWVAWKTFKARRGRIGVVEAVRRTKDPTVVVVLLEDSAALVGLAIAAIALATSAITGDPHYDAAAEVLIGILLACVAIVLAVECKGLLIGEATHPRVIEAVRAMVAGDPRVAAMGPILSMHLGPEDVLVALSVDFDDDLDAAGVERAVREIDAAVRTNQPTITRLYLDANGIGRPVRKSA
jgi:cation diffusion facilitator family transporter